MITIQEMQAVVKADISDFQNKMRTVQHQTYDSVRAMKGFNIGTGAMAVAAGNVLFGALKKAGGAVMGLMKDTAEVTSYNELATMSVQKLAEMEIERANTITKQVRVGTQVVSVQSQVAGALSKTSKEQKAYDKTIKAGETAVNNLGLAQARLNLLRASPPTQSKKDSPEKYAAEIAVWTESIKKQEGAVAAMQAKVGTMNDVRSAEAATIDQITAAGNRVIPIYKKIQEVTLSPEEVKARANAQAKNTMRTLEAMAIDSPLNKKDAIDAFSTFQTLAGTNTKETLKWQQQILDTTSTLKQTPEAFKGAMEGVGKIIARGKMQALEAKQLMTANIPVYRLLSEATGKSIQELTAMSKKGKITAEMVLPVLDEYFNKYKGGAEATARTTKGLQSSMEDAKQYLLQDFGAPVFDALKDYQEAILDFMKNPATREAAERIGTAIAKYITGLYNILSSVFDIVQKVSSIKGDFWTKINAGVDGLKAKFPTLIPILDRVKKGIEFVHLAFNFVIKNQEKIVGALKAVAGGFIAISTATTVAGGLAKIVGLVTGLLSPIGLISLAVGALGAAWATNFGGIRDWVSGNMPAILEGIQGVADKVWGIKSAIEQSGIDGLKTKLGEMVPPDIAAKFTPLLDSIGKVKASITGGNGLNAVASTVVTEVAKTLASVLATAAQTASNLAAEFLKPENVAKVAQGLASLIKGAISGIEKVASDPEFIANVTTFIKYAGILLGTLVGSVATFGSEFILALAGLPSQVTKEDLKLPVQNYWSKVKESIKENAPSGPDTSNLAGVGGPAKKPFLENLFDVLTGGKSKLDPASPVGERLKTTIGNFLKDIVLGAIETFKTVIAVLNPFIGVGTLLGNLLRDSIQNALALNQTKGMPEAKISYPVKIDPKIVSDNMKNMSASMFNYWAADSGLRKGPTEGSWVLDKAYDANTPVFQIPIIPEFVVPAQMVNTGNGSMPKGPDLKKIVEAQLLASEPQEPIKVNVPITPTITTEQILIGGMGGRAANTGGKGSQYQMLSDEAFTQAIQTISGYISSTVTEGVNQGVTQASNNMGLQSQEGSVAQELGENVGGAISTGTEAGLTGYNDAMANVSTKIKAITETELPSLSAVAATTGDQLLTVAGPKLELFRTTYVDPLKDSFQRLYEMIEKAAQRFHGFAEEVAGFKPPPVITPHSPTPFEVGLAGIFDRIQDLHSTSLPVYMTSPVALGGLQQAVDSMETVSRIGRVQGGEFGGSQPFNVTVYVGNDKVVDAVSEGVFGRVAGQIYDQAIREG